MEERHYARSYIYGPTMTAISAEESAAKLLLDASGVVPLRLADMHLGDGDENTLRRVEGLTFEDKFARNRVITARFLATHETKLFPDRERSRVKTRAAVTRASKSVAVVNARRNTAPATWEIESP